MIKDIYKMILISLVLLTSCQENSTLPVNIGKRIFGQWVISPSIHSNVFIMYKYDTLRHDKCSILRFDTPKELYWGYLNKNDSIIYLSCGNTLQPSYKSTWAFDKNSIILDKVWTSVQESKREKLKYFICEFSPDTFTLMLADTLLVEHKMGFD